MGGRGVVFWDSVGAFWGFCGSIPRAVNDGRIDNAITGYERSKTETRSLDAHTLLAFISKKSLDADRCTLAYVSKLTSAGQLTIPKEIRRKLELKASSLVVLDEVGDVVLLRRFEADEETLSFLRKRLRKTGLTRARVNEIVERERKGLWKETSKHLH